VEPTKSAFKPRVTFGQRFPLFYGRLNRYAGACDVRNWQLTPSPASFPCLERNVERGDLHAARVELEPEEVVSQHCVLRVDR
jgi:hypothetical protein